MPDQTIPVSLRETEPGRESLRTAVQPSCPTKRQLEIVGLTLHAIARRLSLSPRTVGKHLECVYRRLGTSDRLTTLLLAQRYSLLPGLAAPGDAR